SGENVGVEMNGKSDRFARPVLIYKKLNRHSFLAIPISTRIKTGSWYVKFTFRKMSRVAVLSQIKVMSVYRLYDRMGELDNFDMDKIITGFNALYKKSSPSNMVARGRG
ncbi:type II toxin-antitoxin system PemK/MazF family toxin, partial [Candidatus Saccharibacteria bacterium]|nr:type II toxin-antitoxin system PemK/MazF family toxin [Candidatus Saccharibacteria bacterium]